MKTLLSETDVELISSWSSKFADCLAVLLFSIILDIILVSSLMG